MPVPAGSNFSRVPVHAASSPIPLQAKLTMGKDGDTFEQEADRVAERVMYMPTPVVRSEGRGGDSELATAPAARAQTKSAGAGDVGATAAPAIVHDVLNSPGQPLDAATRAYFEPRFGRDFGDVRVHADTRAAESATATNARAFTSRRGIVFGAGEYEPDTIDGRRLLAHELVHVTQQAGDTVRRQHDQKDTGDNQTGAPQETKGAVPQDIVDLIKKREGWRTDVYPDQGGFSAGMGHFLTATEKKQYKEGDIVPDSVLQAWAQADAKKAYDAAKTQAAAIGSTDSRLIKALTAVNFQLGPSWYNQHVKTWAFLKARQWEKAAAEAQDSTWYTQTPDRVNDFQELVRSLGTAEPVETTNAQAAAASKTAALGSVDSTSVSDTTVTMPSFAADTAKAAPATSNSYAFKIGVPTGEGWVSANSLNIRKGPGTRYEKTGAPLIRGAAVSIYGRVDGWACIGADQWVSGDYISNKPLGDDKLPAAPSTEVKHAVDEKRAMIARALLERYATFIPFTSTYISLDEDGLAALLSPLAKSQGELVLAIFNMLDREDAAQVAAAMVQGKTVKELAGYDREVLKRLRGVVASERKNDVPVQDAEASAKPAVVDGVALYDQNNKDWADRILGDDDTIAEKGCAISSMAMVVGAVSGEKIDPKEMDEYLDEHNGYSGDAIRWEIGAKARGLVPQRYNPFDISRVDESLAAGKPCVIQVISRKSSTHYVAVVGRHEKNGSTFYTIHDPARGVAAEMELKGGKLQGAKGAFTQKSGAWVITVKKPESKAEKPKKTSGSK